MSEKLLFFFPSGHFDDLDLLWIVVRCLPHHVHDPGGIRLSQAAFGSGHRNAEGILPDKGHTVGITLGNDETFDLGFTRAARNR